MKGVELGLSNESLELSGFNTYVTKNGAVDEAGRLLDVILN